MLVTEPSSKTSLIAREISGAIDRQVSLSNFRSSAHREGVGHDDLGRRAVLQPIDCRIGQDRVGGRDDHARGTVGHQRFGGLHDGAAGVDHVVHQHADPAVDLAHDPVGHDLVGAVLAPALVDERQRHSSQPRGPAFGDLDPSSIRRDHGQLLVAVLLLDVVGEDRQRHQVVDRAVEETLDLVGVQVDHDQPVGPGGLEEVGHQPRRDRLAAAVLLVLARVAVEGLHDGDPLGRGALQRVDHDQVLHDPLVDRGGMALDHEGVAPAHRLLVADVDLGVGELVGRLRHQLGAELVGHLQREIGVRPPAEDHQVLLGGALHSAHAGSSSASWSLGSPDSAL